MVGSSTKTPSKKADHVPQADVSEGSAKLAKPKATSGGRDDMRARSRTVETRASSKTKRQSPSEVAAKKTKQIREEKTVRDSFTMPKADYDKIAALKQKCAENGITVKKSELFRAGLIILASASAEQLVTAVTALETVKTGRPAKT